MGRKPRQAGSTAPSSKPPGHGRIPEALRQNPGGTVGSQQTPNSHNQAARLRAEHLLRVATWASIAVPPLGALLGSRLADLCESTGTLPPSSTHVSCERCESILQVGANCSIRVTKEKKKRKSTGVGAVVNNLTYICHFCKHGNEKPGTPKNHVKTKISQAASRAHLTILGNSPACDVIIESNKPLPIIPATKDGKEEESPKSVGGSSPKGTLPIASSTKKRKRKGWATLKELSSSIIEQTPVSGILRLSDSFTPLTNESAIVSTVNKGKQVASLRESSLKFTSKQSPLSGHNALSLPSNSTIPLDATK